jgi:vitamin B12 transporter
MTRLQKLAFAGAASCALTTGAPALAQSQSTSALSSVVVTARSIEETLPQVLSQYGNRLETVPGEKIKNNGYIDLAQTLENAVPGAFLITQAGPFSYVNLSIQGSRPGDVLWTVDGVRINNRLYNSTQPDTVPASMIERLEVLKGGQGIFYGTQATAGVINTVTRAFSQDFGGQINLGGDQFRGVHANAYVRSAIRGNKLVAWYSKDESDGYNLYTDYQPNTTTRRRSYDVHSYGLKYGYDFTPDLSAQATAIHTIANLDYPSVQGNSVNDRNEDILSGRVDYTPEGPVQLYLKGYYHSWDTNYYTKPNPARYWGYKDFGATAQAELKLHRGVDYSLGYDYQKYKGRDEVLLIEGLTRKTHALFAQARTNDDFSTRARLAAGFRSNWSAGTSATVFNLSGRYDITPLLFVEATGGTSFQLPDVYQLYAVDPDDTKGNPDLKPEHARSITASVGGHFERGGRTVFTWVVTGWKRKIDELILASSTNPPAGFTEIFRNADSQVKVSGGEAILTLPITRDLTLDGSYTVSKERQRTAPTQQIFGRPKSYGRFGAAYAPENLPFGLDFTMRYVGKVQYNVTGFGVRDVGDYWVANLAGRVYFDKARKTQLSARVENLFDQRYANNATSAVRAGSVPATRFYYERLGAPRMLYFTLSHTF